MSLIKWRRNKGMFPELSTFVDDFFSEPRDWTWKKNGFRMPAVNVSETDASFNLEVAAPGLKKEDFNISIDKGVLTISSEKEEKKEEKQDDYTRKEFSYSSFSRSFWLPESVKEEKISAKYVDGVLKITIPKSKKLKVETSKKIKIS